MAGMSFNCLIILYHGMIEAQWSEAIFTYRILLADGVSYCNILNIRLGTDVTGIMSIVHRWLRVEITKSVDLYSSVDFLLIFTYQRIIRNIFK